MSDGEWYVLIEQDRECLLQTERRREFNDDPIIARHHHWELTRENKARDEAHARAWAAELAESFLPERSADWTARRPHRRRIYQQTDGSWLVAVGEGAAYSSHFRVSVARLVATRTVDGTESEPEREQRYLGRFRGRA
ncbi:hypothetical protein ACZ90_70080 [Streptomyces albus subsp. albus]|nr:hypothetical protein ACZ90_70080 [Streptomyces albus subsp. albus]